MRLAITLVWQLHYADDPVLHLQGNSQDRTRVEVCGVVNHGVPPRVALGVADEHRLTGVHNNTRNTAVQRHNQVLKTILLLIGRMAEAQLSRYLVEQHDRAGFGPGQLLGRLDDRAYEGFQAERGIEDLAYLDNPLQMGNSSL